MFIIVALCLSIALNVLLIWFVRKIQTEYILFIRDNLERIAETHNEFNEHLVQINDMEMYFGDQTLVKLLEHSRFTKEKTDEFLSILQGLYIEEEEE
jgi:phosphoglycerol transferase MdoB-like AlkP superfamily enzyme